MYWSLQIACPHTNERFIVRTRAVHCHVTVCPALLRSDWLAVCPRPCLHQQRRTQLCIRNSDCTMHAIAGYGSSSDSEDEGQKDKDSLSQASEINVPKYGSPSPSLSSVQASGDSSVLTYPSSKLPVQKTIAIQGSSQVTAVPVSGGYISKRKRMNTPTDTESITATNTDVSTLLRNSDSHTKRKKLASSLPKHCERLPREHSKPVVSLDWHGRSSSLLLSCSLDGTSRFWDSVNKKSIQRLSLHSGAAISCGMWVADNTFATGGYDNRALVADVEKGKLITSFSHKDYVSALQVHPNDSNLMFTGDYSANIFSWDLRTGKTVQQYRGAGGRILDLAFLQSGKELLASSDIVRRNASSQALRVWDIESAVAMTHQIYPEPYTCPCVQAHPCRSEFYAQSNGNYIVIFSSRKPYKCNKCKRFESHTVDGNKVMFDISPDGRLLCSASADGRVVLYDCDTARPLNTLLVSDSCCVAVAWNQHTSSVVAVSDWSANIAVIQ